jgi:hypothetical protein
MCPIVCMFVERILTVVQQCQLYSPASLDWGECSDYAIPCRYNLLEYSCEVFALHDTFSSVE